MRRGLPGWTGPVLIVLNVAALGSLYVRQESKSEDEKAAIAQQRDIGQRYTQCLVARILSGLPIPEPGAPCVRPTPEEVRTQAQRQGPVELLVILARCLDPNRSTAEREGCVRAAVTPPPTTATTAPGSPRTTSTTQPRGGSASRGPPQVAAGTMTHDPFQPDNPFATLPATTLPTVTLPTLPTVPTTIEVPTTVTLPVPLPAP